ncbi:MAG: dihydrolipoamide acetyltransferase family protein [Thermoleophilaceae bacterium]
MPRLSDSMEEGTVLKWLVEEGGDVQRGSPLVEIETDKANMTYDADSDGVLLEVLAREGDTLAIGEPIARIGEAGESAQPAPEAPAAEGENGEKAEAAEAVGDRAAATEEGGEAEKDGGGAEAADPAGVGDQPATAPQPGGGAKPATQGSPPGPRAGGERLRASPVARRMAGELGVDLERIEGSGPGGRIVKADVESAAERGPAPAAAGPEDQGEGSAQSQSDGQPEAPDVAAPAGEAAPAKAAETGAKGEVTTSELTRLQRTVSRRMAESKATVPDFSLELDVDMTLCIELRERLKEQTDAAPSFNDMVVKAAASALRDHPRVNGAYRDGRFELYGRVNVGVAVAAQDALVVPVVPDADQKSLGEVSRTTRRLVERVRSGEITPPELSGGTFTVSNLGMYGIERFTAIVNAPQAAILTVGALMRKPAVDDRGRVVARDLMTLTLVCDHRILYGADGAEFLARVRTLLEQPLALAL